MTERHPYIVKRRNGTYEVRYRTMPQRASLSIAEWKARPWYVRAWFWVVSL